MTAQAASFEIDLPEILGHLVPLVKAEFNTFTNEHPGAEICTVGLYGDGFHGWLGLWVDTPANRDATVAQWSEQGWVGKDVHGEFGDNGPDFAFCVADAIPFEGFPDRYSLANGTELHVRGLRGEVTTLQVGTSGDAESHAAIAEPLIRAIATELGSFDLLKRAEPFRVVLQFMAGDAIDVLHPTT